MKKIFHVYLKTKNGLMHCTDIRANSLMEAIKVNMEATGYSNREKSLKKYLVTGISREEWTIN